MKIALLGSGVMGTALLGSFVAADHVGDGGEIVVADVRKEAAEAAAATQSDQAGERGITITASDAPADAVTGADVVVLAIKPQHAAGLLSTVGDAVNPAGLVVSIAAGLPAAWLEARLPEGIAVVRVMPNTPATIGQGVSAISAGATATQAHLDLVSELFAGTGLVVQVPENLQSAVTGLSGSGPAYVFAMIDALAEAGTALGLPRALALQLASHTVSGSGAYAARSGQHPAMLREAVSSPGGTTLAGLGVLDDRAVRAAYVAAVRAASDRADELAAGLESPA